MLEDTNKAPTETVSSHAPNLRFGTSYINADEFERTVPDEVMMDKRSGETIYKRVTDEKIIRFNQENINVHDFLSQIKILMAANLHYIRPSSLNCAEHENAYFLTTYTNLMDFKFNEDETIQSTIEGGIRLNPYPFSYNIAVEQNGMFLQLNSRPRDRAIIALLTAMYDDYYESYDGTDPAALAEKEKFKRFGYKGSHAVVNYTITYYESGTKLFAEQTADAYIKINELDYVPFLFDGIYERSRVGYAQIRINSVSAPKLSKALALSKSSNEGEMMKQFLDTEDIVFQSLTTSLFITSTDEFFNLPTGENSAPMIFMSLPEFNTEMDKIGNISNSSGITASVREPDEVIWARTKLWIEYFRKVFNSGNTELMGAETDMDALEQYFGNTVHKYGIFTLDPSDLENYFVEQLSGPTVRELP